MRTSKKFGDTIVTNISNEHDEQTRLFILYLYNYLTLLFSYPCTRDECFVVDVTVSTSTVYSVFFFNRKIRFFFLYENSRTNVI